MGARNIRGFSLSSFTINIYKVLAEILTTRIHHGLDEVIDGASMTGKEISNIASTTNGLCYRLQRRSRNVGVVLKFDLKRR